MGVKRKSGTPQLHKDLYKWELGQLDKASELGIEYEEAASGTAEKGSKGSLMGSILANLLLTYVTGGVYNPAIGAAATAVGAGAGKYFGGLRDAKKADQYAKTLGYLPTWKGGGPIGPEGFDETARSLYGVVDNLKSSAIKSGVTAGASAYMLSGGPDFMRGELAKTRPETAGYTATADPVSTELPTFGLDASGNPVSIDPYTGYTPAGEAFSVEAASQGLDAWGNPVSMAPPGDFIDVPADPGVKWWETDILNPQAGPTVSELIQKKPSNLLQQYMYGTNPYARMYK